jgi:signal transduction histidine kinase
VPKLYADFLQLEQALMNLCVNARDAMGEVGEIRISARSVNLSHSYCASCHEWVEGEFLEIAVSDSGPGIDEAVRKDLFVPFISTKKATSGTGLGLSVVDGIMHEHKGHIMVDSELGRGSTFRLLFPLVREGQAETAE